jgi:hypothetical protein
MLEAEQIMKELVEKIFEMLQKYSAGFVVEHVCVKTETAWGGSNEDQKDLVGVPV